MYIFQIPLALPLANHRLNFKDPDHKVPQKNNPFPCDGQANSMLEEGYNLLEVKEHLHLSSPGELSKEDG